MGLGQLSPTSRLSAVIAISATFFCVEISIGFYTGSLALVADAFHYLNDLVGFVVALAAIRITKRGSSPKGFSFGWQRAQLLGAFFNGVFLLALGLSIFLQSVERFVAIREVERPLLVLIVGGVGLALNVLSILFLHDHGHGHGHGHGSHAHGSSHDNKHAHDPEPAHGTPEVIRPSPEHANAEDLSSLPHPRAQAQARGPHALHRHVSTDNAKTSSSNKKKSHGHSHENLGMLGVLLHVIGDAMNNIGVMGAAAAIQWGQGRGRFYADPAISMAISFMILATSLPLIRSSAKVLLQSSPVGVDLADVKLDLETLPGVESVHELHIWSLDERKTVASAHIVTEDRTMDGFLEKARLVGECLHAYGVHSYTLQPEPTRLVGAGAGSEGARQVRVVATAGAGTGAGDESGDESSGGESDCVLQCGDYSCRDFQCCK